MRKLPLGIELPEIEIGTISVDIPNSYPRHQAVRESVILKNDLPLLHRAVELLCLEDGKYGSRSCSILRCGRCPMKGIDAIEYCQSKHDFAKQIVVKMVSKEYLDYIESCISVDKAKKALALAKKTQLQCKKAYESKAEMVQID